MSETVSIVRALLAAIVAVSLAATLGATASVADERTEGDARQGGATANVPRHAHGHPFRESMQDRLDLTEEQAKALRRIRMEYDRMTIDKTAAIRVGEVELAALLDDARPNLDAIEHKVRAIGALRTELMMGRVTALLKLRKILTRGQYSAFQDVLMQRMESLAEAPLPPGH